MERREDRDTWWENVGGSVWGGRLRGVMRCGDVRRSWGDNAGGILGIAVHPGPYGVSRDADGKAAVASVASAEAAEPAKVFAGDGTTFVVMTNGSMKAWGRNEEGMLGLGNDEKQGDRVGEAAVQLPFVDVGTGRTVTKVGTGERHACALLDDGSVK